MKNIMNDLREATEAMNDIHQYGREEALEDVCQLAKDCLNEANKLYDSICEKGDYPGCNIDKAYMLGAWHVLVQYALALTESTFGENRQYFIDRVVNKSFCRVLD